MKAICDYGQKFLRGKNSLRPSLVNAILYGDNCSTLRLTKTLVKQCTYARADHKFDHLNATMPLEGFG